MRTVSLNKNIVQIIVGVILAFGYIIFSLNLKPQFNNYFKGAIIKESSAFFVVCILIFLVLYFLSKNKGYAFTFLITTTLAFILGSVI